MSKLREGYKQTKVGVIPKKWEVVRFNNIFERVTRKNTTNNTNVLTISAQYGLINQEDFFNKSVASKNLSGYILLKKGEFAYNKSYSSGYPMGAFKRLNFYDEGVLSSLYIYFKIKDDNSDFYEQYFEAGLMNKEIYKIAQEGARNHGLLNISIKEFFHDMLIVKPPLKEQQKIAQILSTWDSAISKQEALIKAKEQLKKGLMQKLLSGEVRFEEFDGEWEEVRLGDVATIIMGQSPSSDTYNDKNIGIPLIQGNADCKNRRTVPRIYTTEKTKECNIGDIIMTVRAPVGSISKSYHNACIGRGVCAIRPKEQNEFLYHFLVFFEEKWEKYSQGSTFTAINSKDVKNMKVPFPPKQEQQKIAQVLTTADKEIVLLKNELETLKEQKRGLMQRLLSGDVRVVV